MEADPFIARLEELDRASLELAERLAGLHAALAEIRRARAAGRRVSEIVASGPGVPARREVRAAWSTLNEALHGFRVQVVKSLVDDETMSIADAARVTGNARQVISRLYHSS